MADIQNWERFINGRWAWTSGGYEYGFTRKSQFGDLDAIIEFDGFILVIEAKHHDGTGPMEYPSAAQTAMLRTLVKLGAAVIVLYGLATLNDPYGIRRLGITKADDRWEDWRGLPRRPRQRLLKIEIDRALGIADNQLPPNWPEG